MAYGDKKIIMTTFETKEGHEVYNLINYYRKLSNQTWFVFIMSSIRDYIAKENDMVANAIQMYIDTELKRRVMGRPLGSVASPEWRKAKSEHMKEVWRIRRENGTDKLKNQL